MILSIFDYSVGSNPDRSAKKEFIDVALSFIFCSFYSKYNKSLSSRPDILGLDEILRELRQILIHFE